MNLVAPRFRPDLKGQIPVMGELRPGRAAGRTSISLDHSDRSRWTVAADDGLDLVIMTTAQATGLGITVTLTDDNARQLIAQLQHALVDLEAMRLLRGVTA